MTNFRLHPKPIRGGRVIFSIPGSKSATNRLLLLMTLAGGNPDQIEGKSAARDSAIMEACMQSDAEVWDVQDAGTAMRFLIARACLLNRPVIITGTSRMLERPIGDLVEGLRQIGFQLQYVEQEGYPPVRILPRNNLTYHNRIRIRAGKSSQFVSALLMIAPCISGGLEIEITDEPASWPYVLMTANYMRQFGAQVEVGEKMLRVTGEGYHIPERVVVPADWSSAAFGILSTGLGGVREVFIPALHPDPEQADSRILDWCRMLGITSHSTPSGMEFSSLGVPADTEVMSAFVFDCRDCPDLAPALLVSVALRGMRCRFSGLESLRIKECDRIEALRVGLEICGITLSEIELGIWQCHGIFRAPERSIPTFGDHRIAMAFALVSLCAEVEIEAPEVVVKSFPDFWVQWAGFSEVEKT